MRLKDIQMEEFKELKERLKFYLEVDTVSFDWMRGYVSGLYEAKEIQEGLYIQLIDWLVNCEANAF